MLEKSSGGIRGFHGSLTAALVALSVVTVSGAARAEDVSFKMEPSLAVPLSAPQSRLYKSTTSLAISSGDLTLDAQGDGNAIFIFQMASTLTTTAGRQIVLTNGAQAANIFWQVGTSATIGTTSVFQGTILADQAITLQTGAQLNGRALARIAAVSLDANTIVKPAP